MALPLKPIEAGDIMFKPHRYLSAALLTAVVGITPACATGAYYRSPDQVRVASHDAYDHAFRDGYSRGRDDARHHRRRGAELAGEYRSGDRAYDRRYGDRDDYRRGYRDAFMRGYEQGYWEFSYRR